MMAVSIRASEDGDRDWGASPEFAEAIAASVAECFPVFHDEPVVITLQNMANGPMIVQDTCLPDGEAIIFLGIDGPRWAQLAFQFAHEFCHHIADQRTMPWDRFHWIEEAICETASLFALRSMAKKWSIAPPYPFWQDYAEKLDEYTSVWISKEDHCLPVGLRFDTWLSERLPLLEANPYQREDNTIIAKKLLPIFERDPAGWHALRRLHSWPRPLDATLAEFCAVWAEACSAEHHPVIEAIGELLDV
jgi:hypothetical protein